MDEIFIMLFATGFALAAISVCAYVAHELGTVVLRAAVDMADDVLERYDETLVVWQHVEEVRVGMHRPTAAPVVVSPDRQALDVWLKGENMGERAEGDVIGMWEALDGTRPCSKANKEKYISRLLDIGVPLPSEPTMRLGKVQPPSTTPDKKSFTLQNRGSGV